MNILLFGSDGERLKAAAASLRSSEDKHVVHLRSIKGFDPNELELNYNLVILLEPSELVSAAYEAHNTKHEDKQITVEERLDFSPPTVRELDEMSGKPHWPDMTIKQLIEYAMDNYDKKVIGKTKAEIIDAVNRLWVADNAAPESDESNLLISIGDNEDGADR